MKNIAEVACSLGRASFGSVSTQQLGGPHGLVCRAILQDHIKNEVAVRSMPGSVVL